MFLYRGFMRNISLIYLEKFLETLLFKDSIKMSFEANIVVFAVKLMELKVGLFLRDSYYEWLFPNIMGSNSGVRRLIGS